MCKRTNALTIVDTRDDKIYGATFIKLNLSIKMTKKIYVEKYYLNLIFQIIRFLSISCLSPIFHKQDITKFEERYYKLGKIRTQISEKADRANFPNFRHSERRLLNIIGTYNFAMVFLSITREFMTILGWDKSGSVS